MLGVTVVAASEVAPSFSRPALCRHDSLYPNGALVQLAFCDYRTGVKARWIVKWSAAWGAVFFLTVCAATAQNKHIRLRNETIATESRGKQTVVERVQPDDQAVTGLFLLQLEDRLQPSWRTDLRALRVELVRYIPEDPFVARLD